MDVRIEGLQSLRANMDRVTKKVHEEADKALQSAALEIIAEAKVNLDQNGSIAFGNLRKSGKVQKNKDGSIDAGFFSSEQDNGYAAYVEFGRGPTKTQTPGDVTLETSLRAWVHRKLGIPEGEELDRAAFLIARKIHRKGTRPKPFFAPAVQKVEAKIGQIIDKIIKKAL
jgi:HK97 gp10 family phage protein